jgi:hypothetical protein
MDLTAGEKERGTMETDSLQSRLPRASGTREILSGA